MSTDRVIHTGTGWSSLERPRFAPGLLLEDEDLNVGVAYTQGLMRLMFKSFFGCGVVCGLDVEVTPTCHNTKRKVEVARGVALDCAGNLIELPGTWSHEFEPKCDGQYPDVIWVVICYTERYCRKKEVACGEDTESQPTRVRSGYEIHLYNDYLPPCVCRCLTKDEQKRPGQPESGCCGGSKTPAAADDERPGTPVDPCDCYRPHLEGVCHCDCGGKCVVLAKINKPEEIRDITDDTPTAIDVRTDVVRRVRPLLHGYVDCFVDKKAVEQREADPVIQVRRAEERLKLAENELQSRRIAVEDALKRVDSAKKMVLNAKTPEEAAKKDPAVNPGTP